MKNFFKKHDLLKITGILVLLTVFLTWLIPQGYHTGTDFVTTEVTRVGLFDFLTYGLLGTYYFPAMIVYIFILGGFYQVLSKTKGYQNLTLYIAKKFKGIEVIFILAVSFLIAALTSVINDYFVVVTFIPFLLSIMAKMKLPKITGFATTFGSLFIGFIGSIYNAQIIGENVSQFQLDYNDLIWYKLILFVIAFILFNLFNVKYLKEKNGKKETEVVKDLFKSKTVSKSDKTWPISVIVSLFLVVGIIAYLPWENLFNITFFKDVVTSIKEFEIFDKPLLSYLLGNVEVFGKWELFDLSVLMLITTIVVKFTSKIKLDDYLTAFGEGFVKVSKFVVLTLLAYFIVEISFMYPVVPTINNWIMTRASEFNAAFATVSGLITGLFSSEYQYYIMLFGSQVNYAYSSVIKQATILMQSTYGVMSLITPASALLLVGLSYLEISYKDWFKYIWRFLIIMTLTAGVFTFILVR